MSTERKGNNRRNVSARTEPWTTAELAEAAGVTDARIRQLLIEGELQGYKAGRDWRVADQVAREWLNRRQAR